MHNIELAWLFKEIADLLEIKGENIFKIRAYQKAADTIATFSKDLTQATEKEIAAIPGFGKALQEKTKEWIESGEIKYLNTLRAEIPQGLLEIAKVPGLGPKLVRRLYEELGIENSDQLMKAAKEQKIRKLKGLGAKIELNIINNLKRMREHLSEVSLAVSYPIGLTMIEILSEIDYIERVEFTGDLRRFSESTPILELIIATKNIETVQDVIKKMPLVKEVEVVDANSVEVSLSAGFNARFHFCEPQQFAKQWLLTTGSKNHLEKILSKADKKGIFLALNSEYEPASEEQIYSDLGLAFLPPQLREDSGEVEFAEKGQVPKVIKLKDYRADLHMHTNYSDGSNTIEELAKVALERGYTHFAITDHSQSLKIASGLSYQDLKRQKKEIEDVANRLGIPILRGIECDILSDGTLDFDDNVLAEMDIVIASIHRGFKQDEETLTKRIINSIKNPHVDIIAHPTGRLICQRDGYKVDLKRIIQAAADYGKVLEINSSPLRLDLNDTYARIAADKGVKIAINSDAHSVQELENVFFGVNYAKRAWLQPTNVINTWSYQELMDFLNRKS